MDLPSVTTVIVIGEPGLRTGYEAWIADQSETDPEVETGWIDTCYQLYTSGTMGLPRGWS